MIFSKLPHSFFLAAAAAVAVVRGAQTVTVCSAGECLEGQSNITRLGAVLSSSSAAYLLLPGQYTSSVQPASLQQSLSSATSTLTFTTGFSNSTTATTPTLPLNIALRPGLLNYPSDLYTGDPTFIPLPESVNATFNATSINRGSIILAPNTVAAIESNNNGAKNRIVLWDTVPYLSQLPYAMAGNLQVVSIQSATCSPACASSAVCSTAGTCICPAGFTGASCEACATGFWGPQCKPCPTGCSKCSEGITGTGVCLTPAIPEGAPSTCNCANGVCSGSTCTCSPGWTTATSANSTQCNTCADGFFLTDSGNCEACGSRCSKCAASTGACTQCDSGLVINSFQPQTCGIANQCSDGQFSTGTGCSVCNAACATCSGPAATDCIKCAPNTFFLNGRCVGIATVPASGVCTGSSLVANGFKGVCDTCPLGCSSCQYDTFGASSVYGDVKCSKCIPGKYLSDGKCIDNCPDGTFIGADGFTCSPCASGCATCTNKADFCLTCKSGQLASAGTCVSNCPSNMFAANGACTPCHPDCDSCTGAGFNQCSTCPASAPVRTSGNRCVKTCAKSEYFDSSSGTCKTCDSSCASCSGGGSSSCLSCNNNKQVLRAGVCTNVDCGNGSGPTSGLGVCLAELVVVPNNSGTPPVVIPPLDPNAQQPSNGGGGGGLIWWQILLIVLGILLLLIIILLLWRRHARKKRAQETEQFKHNLKKQGLWGKLWRNPFSAWWARRKSAAIARRSQDVERMSDAKDWRSNDSSADRRTAIGVPKSISRGSWVTMGQHTTRRPSLDGRSYFTNNAGLGAIREDQRYKEDDWDRSHAPSTRDNGRYKQNAPSSYADSKRGESRYYGQEIEQEEVRSERTYDPYQYPRPDSRSSEGRDDLVSIIKSEYTEGDRYDDRRYNNQRSRTRDERSFRQDYPMSVSSRAQSNRYPREDQRPYRPDLRLDSPSMYSHSTGHPRLLPPNVFDDPPRDAVLSSRFSMSTTAASMHPPPKTLRKQSPVEPVPELKEPARQLTDAEMYKMSKLFPELLAMVSPTKKQQQLPGIHTSPSRNPFRF
ncbi:hypothetical protein M408DRAFT_327977 [Serendipita vermifera MAFF 305830]|uniref:EGF-like domain-containing protein n=1 Tax=Serendipita vermifera MAFF 305830 TaxID=933852 RepID=A0A0C3B2S4_SERVB|nr:hypothetical protein M408DRAFT_327977 [Serendipita vermifera MAFF 305830]